MPDVKISRDSQTELIEAVREKAGAEVPVWLCFTGYYSICVESVITDLSRAIYSRYINSNFNKNETFQSSLALPNIYYEGSLVIEKEIERINKYRQEINNGKKK